MKPPIKGMIVNPYGDNSMATAFLDMVLFMGSRQEYTEAFRRETGHDLDAIISARGLSKLIDESTGRTGDAVAALGDWVAKNYWGVE